MSPGTEELLRNAQALPPADQVELIEALIAGLDEADPQPLDDAWMAEIKRRSAEFDAGRRYGDPDSLGSRASHLTPSFVRSHRSSPVHWT
jgi:putative addiction module component (TIGR02574 family)